VLITALAGLGLSNPQNVVHAVDYINPVVGMKTLPNFENLKIPTLVKI